MGREPLGSVGGDGGDGREELVVHTPTLNAARPTTPPGEPVITRTSLPRLPAPELLPASRAASWAGDRLMPCPSGPAEPLPDPQDADYGTYFDVARTSWAPATALARALPATTAEVTGLGLPRRPAGPERGTDGLPAAPGPATASLGRWKADRRLLLALTQVVVALRDATAQDPAHHPDRPVGHAAPVVRAPVVGRCWRNIWAMLLGPSSEPVAALMSGWWDRAEQMLAPVAHDRGPRAAAGGRLPQPVRHRGQLGSAPSADVAGSTTSTTSGCRCPVYQQITLIVSDRRYGPRP